MMQGHKEKDIMKTVRLYIFVFLCSIYLDLCADVIRHEFDRGFPDDPEIPGAEDLHGQDTLRLVNSEALTK